MGVPTGPDGRVMPRNIRFLEERAKGGVGLIFATFGYNTKFNDCPCFRIDDFSYLPELGEMIDRIHQYGAKFCAQLVPGLSRLHFTPKQGQVYSSSPNKAFWDPNVTCIPYTKEDIKYLVEKIGVRHPWQN